MGDIQYSNTPTLQKNNLFFFVSLCLRGNKLFIVVRTLVFVIKWSAVLLLFLIAVNLKDPYLLIVRDLELRGILTASFFLGVTTIYQTCTSARPSNRRIENRFFLGMIGIIVIVALVGEITFQFKRYTVLHAESNQLQKLGQHFIIGYTHTEDIIPLVEKGAISGIFMTQRNVRNKSSEEVQKEIRFLQNLRTSSNLPPLFIATDQEGGMVSRFSPPLSRLPTLSSLVNQHASSQADLDAHVKEYGKIHGEELKNIGVNVNFSPVVDLKMQLKYNPLNFHSLIGDRAISADASLVSQVALIYSQSLEDSGVIPTVKHFPGLGRIREDTHHFQAELGVSLRELQHQDWLPFKEVITHSHAFMMLGHVRLPEVDPENPVSYSYKVVQGIIRDQWNHEGVLITDDFTMGPIYRGKHGIGAASVSALNAGVDLVLVSYDGEKYYDAMYAVIQADNSQRLDNVLLQKSKKRLERVSDEVLNL
jgi:beta-N-acetylhexosaminidase